MLLCHVLQADAITRKKKKEKMDAMQVKESGDNSGLFKQEKFSKKFIWDAS